MAQDEQIAQSATSIEQMEEALGTEQETLDTSSDQEQSLETDEQHLIPEKFVGKSAFEITQAYREAEKDRGRLANELGSVRKEREELENRLKDLERESARYQPMPTQVPQQMVSQQPQVDPLSLIDAKWDEDPKEAFKAAIRLQQEALLRQTQQQSIQHRQAEANDWYFAQKKENPDYARREPLMQQAVSQFGDLIKPEYLNSVAALKALDLISRGMDTDYYTKTAVDKARQDGLSVREEKRRSQSESTHSDGEQTRDIRKMSLDEMEQLLGEADDD